MVRPYLLGLTGNIACGKSTVLRELHHLGAAVLDTDQVAHWAMRKGTEVYEDIVAAFGTGILRSDGEIDRRALGEIVFSNPDALVRLEAIVHPAVLVYTEEWLAGVREEVAVVDAIKLIESGIADRCDEVWVVICPKEEQLRRLTEYRRLSREEALLRIQAQPPQEEKAARADVVIDNSGRLEETRSQVRAAWAAMQKRRFLKVDQRSKRQPLG